MQLKISEVEASTLTYLINRSPWSDVPTRLYCGATRSEMYFWNANINYRASKPSNIETSNIEHRHGISSIKTGKHRTSNIKFLFLYACNTYSYPPSDIASVCTWNSRLLWIPVHPSEVRPLDSKLKCRRRPCLRLKYRCCNRENAGKLWSTDCDRYTICHTRGVYSMLRLERVAPLDKLEWVKCPKIPISGGEKLIYMLLSVFWK